MTLDRPAFQAWLDRYVAAWKSYDPVAIGDLFSKDAEYRYHPKDEPVVGRAAIVADWLDGPDPSGTYDAHYEPLAIDGDTHVAHGWTRYFTTEGELRDEYWNVYSVRFDAAGQASSFTEWWIQDRAFARTAREAAIARALAEAGVNVTP
jgi:SnoaL-like domain